MILLILLFLSLYSKSLFTFKAKRISCSFTYGASKKKHMYNYKVTHSGDLIKYKKFLIIVNKNKNIFLNNVVLAKNFKLFIISIS